MQTETKAKPDVWKNDNGTWSHRKDHRGEFSDKNGAETDLRFTLEWERAQ